MKKWLKKIYRIFFPKNESLLKENIPLDTTNPYIAARREWTFMFGDILKSKHNWQRITFLIGIMNIILLTGLITVALQSKFIPYAVKIDNLGNTNFGGLLIKQNDISPIMINAMLRRYITEVRSVIADPVAQKHQLDFIYRSTLGEARAVIDHFYQSQNPFDFAKNATIDVAINSVLSKSANTWQIQWTEVHHDSAGRIVLENRFEGLVTVQHRAPIRMDDININPLGLYVTHLSWASQQ